MFDKLKFAQILRNITSTYESQRDFSKKSGINRTYLSQYMNMKLDEPPKPKILEKLANASHNITNYPKLMEICGYIDSRLDTNSLLSYKELENLETEYNKLFYKLNAEESEIMHTIFEQFIECLNNDYITPETFNPNELLSSFNFLSTRSRQKLYNCLKAKFAYYYKKKLLHKTSNNPNSILSNSFNNSHPQFYMCPVYGQIPAGEPNWAEEYIEGRIPIDPELMNIANPEECYFLRVNGESMNKEIKNGAYALIRKTDWVENGEIAVVLVNGYDATLKKFTQNGDVVVLEPMSDDPSFQTQIYTKDTSIKVIGKYIGKMEMK